MSQSLILQNQLLIYNNQARSGKIEGGLSVSYEFFPAPAIFWDFEVFDQDSAALEYKSGGELAHPFVGHQIILPDPWLSGQRANTIPRRTLGTIRTGSAPKVFIGNRELKGKSFNFYLPNAKFQSTALLHNSLVKEVTHQLTNDPKDVVFVSSEREGYLQTAVTENIDLSLHTPTKALNWLDSYRSTGTYLTTSGTLKLSNETSIVDASNLLEKISDLLSFANGGFVAPLIVAMTPSGFEQDYPTQYATYVVDPIEHLGGSWLGSESDVTSLLKCLPAYQNMLKTTYWEKSFHLVLIWYFQAIQRQGIQVRGKPWPVGTNALGAALEKLASVILVEETKVLSNTKFKDTILEDRIRILLKTIGISDLGPKYRTGDPNNRAEDAVWWFVQMRNDATHPKSRRTWTAEQVNPIYWNALQWVEEALLWRLGYQGRYQNRATGQSICIVPRYDLGLRDPAW